MTPPLVKIKQAIAVTNGMIDGSTMWKACRWAKKDFKNIKKNKEENAPKKLVTNVKKGFEPLCFPDEKNKLPITLLYEKKIN